MRYLLLIVVIVCTTACSSTHPDRFLTVNEMFGTETTPPNEKSEAIKKSVFEASYVEVYRAATISASQALFSVESESRKTGLILATRTVMQKPIGTDTIIPTQHTYFYAISVKELGPKTTEVSIAAKVQGRCQKSSPVAIGVMTLGLGIPVLISRTSRCTDLSNGMWAAGDFTAGQDLGNFMTFVRNNLIAANAI